MGVLLLEGVHGVGGVVGELEFHWVDVEGLACVPKRSLTLSEDLIQTAAHLLRHPLVDHSLQPADASQKRRQRVLAPDDGLDGSAGGGGGGGGRRLRAPPV